MTNEQNEAKKQQLMQLGEVNALAKELGEVGAIEISDDELDQAAGGTAQPGIPGKNRKKFFSTE